jgi:hypothetical protein
MLDWPTFGDALWRVSDVAGIRPEWQLPVLYLESGFDPSIVNSIGCTGLNQFCPNAAGQYVYVPVPIDQYRAWSASEQLAGPILAYWRDALRYGSIRSATRLMLAQLGPALLASATSLDSPVYAAPSRAYAANSGFDVDGKGYFTVGDLAAAMARASASSAVRQALANAYSMRPAERSTDPVYGDDWYSPGRLSAPRRLAGSPVFTVAAAIAMATLAGYAALQRRRFA